MTIQLWDRKNNRIVSADLLAEMTPEDLGRAEGQWQTFRERARNFWELRGGAVPEHNHSISAGSPKGAFELNSESDAEALDEFAVTLTKE